MLKIASLEEKLFFFKYIFVMYSRLTDKITNIMLEIKTIDASMLCEYHVVSASKACRLMLCEYHVVSASKAGLMLCEYHVVSASKAGMLLCEYHIVSASKAGMMLC